MNTTEALEAMTDRGKFELLATAVLSIAKEDYRAITNTGVNARGDTIPAPVDGFCKVLGSKPPLFIMVEHTTTKPEKLKGKWLHDRGTSGSKSIDDGDLIKAGHEAREIRKKFPNARFIVVLTTNRRVKMGLLTETYEKGQDLGVDVDIWGQSRLARELDTKSEGQWLRENFLGIDTEMLSSSLLRSLCKQSLVEYAKQTCFITEPQSWIPREIDDYLEAGILQSQYPIQLLVGGSGSGKSSSAYQALKKHLEAGGYGMWIDAGLIQECTSVENALDKFLLNLYPRLQVDAGKIALRLAQGGGKQLLIIVDDINRTHEPARLLRKLVTWSSPSKIGTNSPGTSSPYSVLCPVWPQNMGYLDQYGSSKPWIDVVSIEAMSQQEGMQAVQIITSHAGIEITAVEAYELAGEMGNEPILIGLFGSLLADKQRSELSALARDAVDRFVESGIKKVVADTSYLSTEYHMALLTISHCMLQDRNLQPSWVNIEDWLHGKPHRLDQLRTLAKHGVICQLNDQDELIFRHDRIREAMLAKSITCMLETKTPDPDILWEPFYAEIIGRSLAGNPFKQEIIEKIRKYSPLALFAAIRYFGTPEHQHQRGIVQAAKKWVEDEVATGLVPDSVLRAVCWSLVLTDSPVVLDISERLPELPLMLLARFRNGCIRSGISYYTNGDTFFINPGIAHYVVRHAKQRYRNQLRDGLHELMTDSTTTDRERSAALNLAGDIGFIELRNAVAKCWELTQDKDGILPQAIWAATQCYGDKPYELLNPLVQHWASLPDKKGSFGVSLKYDVAGDLHYLTESNLGNSVITYLITQCNLHESLRGPIMNVLSDIDSPTAIEFIIRSITDKNRTWYSSVSWRWDRRNPHCRTLSRASMEKLAILWESPENDDSLRQRAFRLWLQGIDSRQLELLQAISCDSPVHREALLRRAEFGDRSVLGELLPILHEDADWHRAYDVAHHVWCNGLMEIVEDRLKSLKGNIPTDFSGGDLGSVDYCLSELLMQISADDAEQLLVKHWGHLGYNPMFIQTALYIGTPECLELAGLSMDKCPRNIPVLKHVGLHFSLSHPERRECLGKQHAYNLLPYLDRLGESELRQMAEMCEQLGIVEWGREHISHLLNEEHRKRYYPSEADLYENLDDVAARRNKRAPFWLWRSWGQPDKREQALDTVDCWLGTHPTARGLKVVSECIREIGTRMDLSMLRKYEIEGPEDEIGKIREDIIFSVCRKGLN